MPFEAPYVIAGLQRYPVQAEASWEAKLKATRAPEYLPATSYTLKLSLRASELFLPVWINRSRGRLEYAKSFRHDAVLELEAGLLYFEDWSLAQQVTVGLGVVGQGLEAPVELHTGVVYDWAIDPVFRVERRQMLLVALNDTQNVRGRWRLKPALREALPPWLVFLGAGRCSGSWKMP